MVEAGDEVFFTAPFAVRPIPHVVASFGRDNQIVAVCGEIFAEEAAKAFFGAACFGTVVVGEVEVGNAEIECGADRIAANFVVGVGAEILP